MGRERQVYLKRSLGTGDAKQANIRIKHVLIEFDRILSQAQALKAAPKITARRDKLSRAEIDRMAEALYGKLLADDEGFRFGGRARIVETVEWIRRTSSP